MQIQVESARYIRSEGEVAITARLSNGKSGETFVLVVPVRFYEQSGIGVGELSEERFEALAEEAGVHAAFKRGVRILEIASHSKRALLRKLIEKGISKQDAEKAAQRLERFGYLNERKIALRIAQLSLKKGWGRMRILADLRQKGYDNSACRAVEICLDRVNFERRAARVILKRFGGVPEDEKIKQKLYRTLVNLGYSYSEIGGALTFLEECEDLDELYRTDIMDSLCFE